MSHEILFNFNVIRTDITYAKSLGQEFWPKKSLDQELSILISKISSPCNWLYESIHT